MLDRDLTITPTLSDFDMGAVMMAGFMHVWDPANNPFVIQLLAVLLW